MHPTTNNKKEIKKKKTDFQLYEAKSGYNG